MQSPGGDAMLFFLLSGHDESYSFISANGQKLPKLSSFFDCLFFPSFLTFKERISGLHISPRDAAIGQIANYTGQFRDLG